MLKSVVGFLLIYAAISAIPALVLLARGRGWRPRYLVFGFLLSWTGGGWIVMLWLAFMERSSNFVANTKFFDAKKDPAKQGR